MMRGWVWRVVRLRRYPSRFVSNIWITCRIPQDWGLRYQWLVLRYRRDGSFCTVVLFDT